ncbi:MAG: hypothetical protein KJO07_18525 [Deltaproteobacteria bacterium]|nr:hypothetical protein [Deltaproteobacteria bacterium]
MTDVVVVGCGVAGCAAAATAIELGFDVTVYEAGSAGPLPSALRSPDLNRAAEAPDWWWPDPYPAGRGLGGGSAVNGMIVQQPPLMDEMLWWAWNGFDPVASEPGPMARRVIEVAGARRDTAVEPVWLSVRDGFRQTAADVWLNAHPNLSVQSGVTVSASDVQAWSSAGRRVLLAAGAHRSPELVGLEPRPARDHRSAVVGFTVPADLRSSGDRPAGTALIRLGDVQILVLEHTDSTREWGALIVSAMVDQSHSTLLADGIRAAIELLDDFGVAGTVRDEPAPVAHACCTLTGIDTGVPVVDAATLPELPSVNPMLTVAAHARRETWRLLHS